MIPLDQILNISGSGTVNKYLGILVISSIMINRVIKKKTFMIDREFMILFLFATYALVSYFWSINKHNTFSDFLSLLSLIVFYVVCINKEYSLSEKGFIKLCCILGGVLISLYLISTKDLYYDRVLIKGASGFETDPNDLSSGLAFGALLLVDDLLRTKGKFTGLVKAGGMVIILYGMILTGSRGGILGLGMGIITLFMLNARYTIVPKARVMLFSFVAGILIVVIFGTGLLSTNISSQVLGRLTLDSALETGGTGRVTIWIHSIQSALESPFWGYGFGGGAFELYQKFGTYVGTHNVILFLLLGTGVVGIGLFLSFIVSSVKRSVMKKDSLTLAMMAMLLIFCGTLDYLLNKNFWNVMIYAQIGLGVTQSDQRVNVIEPD